jgi:acetolactate synthase I/III small subunit
MTQHTLIITALNRPGIMARIVSLLSSRDISFDHIQGTTAERPDLCRIHLSIRGKRGRIEQICKQLDKLIDTIKVVDIEHGDNALVREYLLVTVTADKRGPEVLRLVELFGANLVEVSARSITVDLVGSSSRVDHFLEMLRPFGLRDTARSGHIAVANHHKKEFHHVRSNVLR